jgi:hypothetical protein
VSEATFFVIRLPCREPFFLGVETGSELEYRSFSVVVLGDLYLSVDVTYSLTTLRIHIIRGYVGRI